jgi:hypothetical protein
VRAVQARIQELRSQTQKLGGNNPDKPITLAESADSTHPTLHNLPLLGVAYADLYRRMQIQETVYETLTQQFELAKVQEAKEIPSVKVLDSANVPEHKSYPPRLFIMLLCTFVGALGATIFVLGKDRWAEIDPQEPEKLFVQDAFRVVNARMPWAPPNGSRVQAAANRIWVRFVARNGAHADTQDSAQNGIQNGIAGETKHERESSQN